jgi:hypothetical protein
LVDTLTNAGEEINYLPDDVKVATTLLELEINAPIICLKPMLPALFKGTT